MMRWNCESLTKSHNGSWFKLSEQEYAVSVTYGIGQNHKQAQEPIFLTSKQKPQC